MSKTLRLDDLAEDELSSAVAWYERAREGLGGEFWNDVQAVLLRVQEAPQLGTIVSGVDPRLGRALRVMEVEKPLLIRYRWGTGGQSPPRSGAARSRAGGRTG